MPKKTPIKMNLNPDELAWMRRESERRGEPLAAILREAVRKMMEAGQA